MLIIAHDTLQCMGKSPAWSRLFHDLNESQRRWLAGAMAIEEGWGGVAQVQSITGLSAPTIIKGMREIRSRHALTSEPRIRPAGAGRTPVEEVDPAVLETLRVYPGFPIRLGALPGFVVGDLMWKALWKLVENEQRFPRRGGRVLCVHGAVSFHRARPCGRPVCRPGRDEGSLEPYRQNCDESGLQISPPGPLRCHDLPDRGQPRYSCTDSEPFAYPVREAETAIKQASSEHFH